MTTLDRDSREDIIEPAPHKGQEIVNKKQKGSAGVSKKKTPKHSKDESHGASKNTTKKQQNSI